MSKYLSEAAVLLKWTGGDERRITPSELLAESAAWLCGVSGELCPCELLVFRPVDRHCGNVINTSANIFNILFDHLSRMSSSDQVSGCFAMQSEGNLFYVI